ncbi:MAG: cupin-like domain-containing protein [Saprospiraceae bacterium]|nr:cupin-like domain-containing protein [Saprospiraceae bacterium]
MKLMPVDRRTGLNRESFKNEYLKKQKPVIFTDFMDQWPAKDKWNIEYLKEKYGHISVPLFSENSSKPGKKYMVPDTKKSFREFLEILESGPTTYRMFLFNIFKHAPELIKDFSIPTIMDGWVKSFPFMFFGGQGSTVPLHYDIDYSHVFLNQFHGRKRIVLFSHDESDKIYHHPYTVASYIDVNNPDYENYPALRNVVGYECMLYPGETIFMPSGYWHYIEYTDGGYSMALRSNDSVVTQMKGVINIARHFVVDKSMNHLLGSQWRKMKDNMAKHRAEKYVG